MVTIAIKQILKFSITWGLVTVFVIKIGPYIPAADIQGRGWGTETVPIKGCCVEKEELNCRPEGAHSVPQGQLRLARI